MGAITLGVGGGRLLWSAAKADTEVVIKVRAPINGVKGLGDKSNFKNVGELIPAGAFTTGRD